jgi:prepilin-type N-terminal cleavage/methylation domain-containing protein
MTNKGFTLVEVLIAVGVLSVASAAFLPSFSGALNEKKIQQSADAVRDALATTRTRALTEVGNPGAAETSLYKYAGVKFDNGSGTYYQFRSAAATPAVCGGAGAPPAGTNVVVDATKTLPSGVVARINAAGSPLCVFFAFKTAEAVTTKGADAAVACSD